jgi:hypothetical protein
MTSKLVLTLGLFFSLTAPAGAQSSASSSGFGPGPCIPNPPPADSGCTPVNVPEPEGIAPFAMGLAALMIARRQRRKRKPD